MIKRSNNSSSIVMNSDQQEKNKQIPEGTRILSEEERMAVLTDLKANRERLANILGHMPISMKTFAIREKKDKMEKQLSELDSAVETFSQKIVYINRD